MDNLLEWEDFLNESKPISKTSSGKDFYLPIGYKKGFYVDHDELTDKGKKEFISLHKEFSDEDHEEAIEFHSNKAKELSKYVPSSGHHHSST